MVTADYIQVTTRGSMNRRDRCAEERKSKRSSFRIFGLRRATSTDLELFLGWNMELDDGTVNHAHSGVNDDLIEVNEVEDERIAAIAAVDQQRALNDARHDILGTRELIDHYEKHKGAKAVRLTESGPLPFAGGGLREQVDKDRFDDALSEPSINSDDEGEDDDGDDENANETGNQRHQDFDPADRSAQQRMIARLASGKEVEGEPEESDDENDEETGEGRKAGAAYGPPEASLKGILMRSGLGEAEVAAAIAPSSALQREGGGRSAEDSFSTWLEQGGKLGKAAKAEADFFADEEQDDEEEDAAAISSTKGAVAAASVSTSSWSLVPSSANAPLLVEDRLSQKPVHGKGLSASGKRKEVEGKTTSAAMELDKEEGSASGKTKHQVSGYSETAPSFGATSAQGATAVAKEEEWPLKPEFRGAAVAAPAIIGATTSLSELPKSDAVLSCPFCFTVLTRLCQRHDKIESRFRSADAEGAVVDWAKTGTRAGTSTDGRFHPLLCKNCRTPVGQYERLGSAGVSSFSSCLDALDGLYHFEGVVEGEG